MGSQRLFLFEHTTRNCLFNSYQKGQKRIKTWREERPTIGQFLMTRRLPRRFMFQLGSQEDDQQVLVPRRFMFQLESPEDARKKSEGGKGHLRTFFKIGI